MADYNELHNICDEFCDNIDGWCELDDGDMIDKSLVKMKTALLKVESTEKSPNISSFQFPNAEETWNHVTSWLSWNPQKIDDIELLRKVAEVVYKFVVGNKKR